MPFLFNPCRPCCTIPKCGLCGSLSLPRSWNVTFNGNGQDTSFVNSIDDGEDVCSAIFLPITVSFSAQYTAPCRWAGFSTKILKTCKYGSNCNSNQCICDCSTCFDVLVGPVRRSGAGCYGIVYGGGWIKAAIGDGVNCRWFGADGPNVIFQLKKDIPVSLTMSTSSGGHTWTATYQCGDSSCQDEMVFTLQSQSDPAGQQPNQWPPTVKVYQAVCGVDVPKCLCTYCEYDWSVTLPQLTVLPQFITAKTSTSLFNFGTTNDLSQVAWPGGDLAMSRFDVNPSIPGCFWEGADNGQAVLPNSNTKPDVSAAAILAANVLTGYGTYLRAVVVGVSSHFFYQNFGTSPATPHPVSYQTAMVYYDDQLSSTSDCGDYDSRTLKLLTTTDYRLPGNSCGMVDPDVITFLRANYIGPGPNDFIVTWPDTITLNKVPKATAEPPCPNPYQLTNTQVDPGSSVNDSGSQQFTDDTKTTIELMAQGSQIVAKVTAVYTNRCKNPNGPTTLIDIKNYSMSQSSFDCLGSNTLTIQDDRSGSICNNWPSTLTIAP